MMNSLVFLSFSFHIAHALCYSYALIVWTWQDTSPDNLKPHSHKAIYDYADGISDKPAIGMRHWKVQV